MKNITRFMLLAFLVLGVITPTKAAWQFNPFTGKQDYHDMRLTVPSWPGDACSSGEMARDTQYLYVCSDTNTWSRLSLSEWTVERKLIQLNGIQIQLNGVNLQK